MAATILGLGCSRSQPPDIVLVLIDTFRADHVGYAGFEGPISSHLDRLAADAYRFRNCYAAAPWTKPSVASLFTSLYPLTHNVTNQDGLLWGSGSAELEKGVLPDRLTTLAEVLRGRGYATAAFVSNPWITTEYGFAQGFDRYDDEGFYPPAGQLLDRAEAWLERDQGRPFFLYLHFMEVHGPYAASPPARREIAESPSVRSDRVLTRAELAGIPKYLKSPPWTSTPAARRLQTWKTEYAAQMVDLDRFLGMLFDRDGLLETSWVIVTSDHGEELFEHGGWNHGGTLFEEQLRVPLVVRPPGGVPSGRDIGDLVSLLDLMPTLVAIAGGTPPQLHGRDLRPLLDGGHAFRSIFATAVTTGPGPAALRKGDYKLILNQTSGEAMLFDVVSDPGETRNLAADQPEKVRELMAELREVVAGAGRVFDSGGELTDARRELLESLGYTN